MTTPDTGPRLRPGDAAPEFTLTAADGTSVGLADLPAGPVIVYFFPKAFTPGCTTEACDFRDHRATLRRVGYSVVGISADRPERLAEFRDANRIDYPLLSDLDHVAARSWGAYGPKVVNGEATVGPLRSTFVLDADRVVQSAEYELDPNGHVSSLLTNLQS